MDHQRDEILSTVCGMPDEHLHSFLSPSKAFFDYYDTEISAGPVLEHSDVLFLIHLLREHPDKTRSEIQEKLLSYCGNRSPIIAPPNGEEGLDIP